MFPAAEGAEMGRVVVDHFDIRYQAGARVGSLDHVMAEQSIRGEAVLQGRLERGDFVDAFAGIGPFAEQVLINVGDGSSIDVESCVTREQGGQTGTGG